jgi:hypothetical protein
VTDQTPRTEIVSRRNLFRAGGVMSLGALVAACGTGSSDAPGRVGYAPPATPLPTAEVNDAVLLRTGASYQNMAVEVLQRVLDDSLVSDDYTTVIERFIEDHTAAADHVNELAEAAGGEPFTCPNPWLDDRTVGPMFAAILGDEEEGIEPSDDPQRDALNMIAAVEDLMAATFQSLAAKLSTAELRRESVLIAASGARQAALIAYTVTGSPAGYVDPALTSTEPPAEETGYPVPYAITSRFAELTAITLRLGKPNAEGAIPSVVLATPAENAYAYEYVYVTC